MITFDGFKLYGLCWVPSMALVLLATRFPRLQSTRLYKQGQISLSLSRFRLPI